LDAAEDLVAAFFAQFTTVLIGLERIEAIEAALRPLVSNATTEGWDCGYRAAMGDFNRDEKAGTDRLGGDNEHRELENAEQSSWGLADRLLGKMKRRSEVELITLRSAFDSVCVDDLGVDLWTLLKAFLDDELMEAVNALQSLPEGDVDTVLEARWKEMANGRWERASAAR